MRRVRQARQTIGLVPLVTLILILLGISACGDNGPKTAGSETTSAPAPADIVTIDPTPSSEVSPPATVVQPELTTKPASPTPTVGSDAATSVGADTTSIDEPQTPVPASVGRASRIQVAVVIDAQVFEIDDGGKLVGTGIQGGWTVDWIGTDRTMAVTTERGLELWHPERAAVVIPCSGCQGAAGWGRTGLTINDANQLVEFDLETGEVISLVDADLPLSQFGPHYIETMVQVGNTVIVNQPDPEGASAYGGPQIVSAIDIRSGEAVWQLSTESNIGFFHHSLSADRSQLAVGPIGWRAGMCANYASVWLIDTATGETVDIPHLGVPGDLGWDAGVGDLFWSGPVLYAVLNLAWESPIADVGCESTFPTALYRWIDGDWQVVDYGPLDGVRPTSGAPGSKVVTVNSGTYLEDESRSESIGESAYILGSTTPPVETDLTPPNLRPPAIDATFDQLVAYAEAGDVEGLASLAGPDFAYTFGVPDPLGPLDAWQADDPSWILLELLSGPGVRDEAGMRWSDRPSLACRTAIGSDGTWLFLVCGD